MELAESKECRAAELALARACSCSCGAAASGQVINCFSHPFRPRPDAIECSSACACWRPPLAFWLSPFSFSLRPSRAREAAKSFAKMVEKNLSGCGLRIAEIKTTQPLDKWSPPAGRRQCRPSGLMEGQQQQHTFSTSISICFTDGNK